MEILKDVYGDEGTMSYYYREIEKVEMVVEDIAQLEDNIIKQLCQYYEHEKHRSWKRIKFLIDREIKKARMRFGNIRHVPFSALTIDDGDGEEREFDCEDELALVTRKLEGKDDIKKIVSLATDDRKVLALKGLFDGDTVVQISKTLARRYGGNSESHRKHINRFKADCYNALNVAY